MFTHHRLPNFSITHILSSSEFFNLPDFIISWIISSTSLYLIPDFPNVPFHCKCNLVAPQESHGLGSALSFQDDKWHHRSFCRNWKRSPHTSRGMQATHPLPVISLQQTRDVLPILIRTPIAGSSVTKNWWRMYGLVWQDQNFTTSVSRIDLMSWFRSLTARFIP